MGSPAKLHSFCQLCMSPSPHHHDHQHVEYSRCLDMRMNLDYSASRSSFDSPEMYPSSPYSGSPQSRSSCMYSLHANSPPIVHPLALRSSAEQFISPSKENGLYREIPPQCRRRLDFNHNDFMGLSKAVPVTVAKRNERERNRVKLINTTFQTLRQHLPVQSRGAKGQAKKLSKVQTLRSAIEYIRNLEGLVEDRKGKNSKEVIKDCTIKKETLDEDISNQEGMSDASGISFDIPYTKETKKCNLINNNNNNNDNHNLNNNNLPANNVDRNAICQDSHFYCSRTIASPCLDLNGVSNNDDNNNDPINNNNNNSNNNNDNSNTNRSSEVVGHHCRDQFYPYHPRRSYHHLPESQFEGGRGQSSYMGINQQRYASSSGPAISNPCHSEGGSASPVDSDISNEVTAAEEDEFFDFDLWF